MKKTTLIIINLFLLQSIMITSCNKYHKDNEQIKNASSPERLYNLGMHFMKKQDYTKAIKSFDTLYHRYPNHKITGDSEVEQANAFFLNKNYGVAIDTFQHFILYHPDHPKTEYAMYMIGLAYYAQLDDIYRDQHSSDLAHNHFMNLLNHFPNTRYREHVNNMLTAIANKTAGKSMYIAYNSMIKGNLIAAITRYKNIISKYPHTSYVEEAYYRIAECYTALKLHDVAQKYVKILQNRYPKGVWTRNINKFSS